jgi:hypothetical protein
MLRSSFSNARALIEAASGSPTGLDYLEEIKGKTGTAREAVTLRYFRERWVPDSMLDFAHWPRVTITKTIAGIPHKLTVQVSPDFAKVGSDEASAVVVPMWPTTAQHVADELSVRTIGKALARAVYEQAAVRGDIYLANPGEPYYDLKKAIPRDIDDSGAWAASAKKRIAWLDKKVTPSTQARTSTLVAGYSKDVTQQRSAQGPGGKIISGNQLAIYGGGGGKTDGWAIQPFPGPHVWSYGGDYSHGSRFARNRATLQVGDLPQKSVRLDAIAKDPVLSVLLSETGPFDNRMSFPTTGSASSSSLGFSSEAGGEFSPEERAHLEYVPSTGRLTDTDSDDVPASIDSTDEDEPTPTDPIPTPMSPRRLGAWTFGTLLVLGLLKMAVRPRVGLGEEALP